MAGLELDLNVEQWAFGVGRDQVAELPPGWLFHVQSAKWPGAACHISQGSGTSVGLVCREALTLRRLDVSGV